MRREIEASFARLSAAADCASLQGTGLAFFYRLRAAVESKLNFKQKKVFSELGARLTTCQNLATKVQGAVPPPQHNVLVCGAGPVGLRTAVEAAMLGFKVTVVEKRSSFSRANILTFWAETMADMLALGARTYCPNLQSAGGTRHMGTREVQLVLLKDLLLLGGTVVYGHEIVGLAPPRESHEQWQGCFRPYISGRRQQDSTVSQQDEAQEPQATREVADAAAALDFCKQKDYAFQKTGNKGIELERATVEQTFISLDRDAGQDEMRVPFDTYIIAEGAKSDSTQKLGFNKTVYKRNPVIGFVINMKYNREGPVEKGMKSFLSHVMNPDFPLRTCPVLTEFVEYLKGETHFFAMVCALENKQKLSEEGLAEIDEQVRSGTLTEDAARVIRENSARMGLIEMGIVKEKLPRGQLLQPSNVNADRMRDMALMVASDCGLPTSAQLFHTNPVQMFDFSSLAQCDLPVKILCADGSVEDGVPQCVATYSASGGALVFPTGDALQEPLWTSGLGVNRGFHSGLNAVYSALVGSSKGIPQAVEEIHCVHSVMKKMKWGDGALAGGGSGESGVKPGEKWTANPHDRLPMSSRK